MAELKYRQIFETIKSRILDGTYPVGFFSGRIQDKPNDRQKVA